jgi:hypothetical protein
MSRLPLREPSEPTPIPTQSGSGRRAVPGQSGALDRSLGDVADPDLSTDRDADGRLPAGPPRKGREESPFTSCTRAASAWPVFRRSANRQHARRRSIAGQGGGLGLVVRSRRIASRVLEAKHTISRSCNGAFRESAQRTLQDGIAFHPAIRIPKSAIKRRPTTSRRLGTYLESETLDFRPWALDLRLKRDKGLGTL